ncbi:excinuclease ABC subunit UvrB [Bryobacter aggregatus]|uniref:excinuclease ABC subunit UvrB n=1 Tax=Bryobacter aggregatus TaxID=360054 RepID=UPI0006902302|nr:excinuclease ABC subunit UvrB [Bryobacter aggregatus]
MSTQKFKLAGDYRPRGDQETAIAELVRGLAEQEPYQTLLGVTGSGKTFTMAKIIETINRPSLILAHNKTLAAQLYQEFKQFFPNNAVEYFVSYYDYYQPEAYIPNSDTYIEKESTVNDELDKLRLAATRSLFERRDVVIISSVSCIYGLGSPEAYYGMLLMLEKGKTMKRADIIAKLVEILYQRNDQDFTRGTFRVRGDVIEVFPTYDDNAFRIELWGDEIEGLSQIDPLLGTVKQTYERLPIYPKSHYVLTPVTKEQAQVTIEQELLSWNAQMEREGKLIEAQRIWQRTQFDLEMIKTIGYCHGIENYSRHFTGRLPGEAPPTLLDYLPADAVLFIDESHVTMPQLQGMWGGDRSRKENLVKFGFRLPSALDNRPLTFEEFENRVNQAIFVSATPGPYELTKSGGVIVEQVIRPTGLIDPVIEVRPIKGQVDDLLQEIRIRAEKGERVLITTLTKRMSEDLSQYYSEVGVKVQYLHSEVTTLDRVKILRDLRKGIYDCLIGVNLLREGLDLPEVSLVAILDADKEGFLRSTGSLIQTIGRAARNANGRAILYADVMTDSMRRAIDETNRRREIQKDYNERNGITPQSIIKPIDMNLVHMAEADYITIPLEDEKPDEVDSLSAEQLVKYLAEMEQKMRDAAKSFEFEKAAQLRDRLKALRSKLIDAQSAADGTDRSGTS